MTNQVNMLTNQDEAFKKWLSDVKSQATQPLNYNNFLIKEAWQAATQASESEINSLKERVAELQSHLSSQVIEITQNDVTLESYAHKVAELQASNNQLREAGQALVDRWNTPKWKDAEHTAKFIHALEKALSSTSPQSLAEHDNATIGRCKNIVADDALAITFQSMGAYRSAIIKHIGELKATP